MAIARDHTDWRLVWVLWGAGLGAAAQYGKVSVVFDQLGTLFPGAGTALGWAVSLVGGVGIVLGITAGVVVARVTLRRALLFGLWLGAGVSFFQALSPAFGLFLVSRVLEGVSHLAVVVAAPTLIAKCSTYHAQGLALTLWGTFFGVAFALLVWLGLPLVDALGVPALFAAHGVYLAVFALVLGALLPREDAVSAALPTAREVLRRHLRVYRSPWLGAPAAGWLFYTFCFVSFITLIPPVLDPGQRAAILAAIPLVSIASSMTLGVWMLQRMSAVSVVQIGFLSAACCSVALALVTGDALLCLALAAAFGLVQGASFAAVPELNEAPENQALANGAMAQTGNIGNTLGTPVLFFLVTSAGYAAMLVVFGLVLFAGFAVHAFLRRRRTIAATA
ncbi:MAG: MFS transporter [Dinoroseobacter sp.]|nr:MFS transporter [Dinoroseobacter sp.]